jgi:hypothetical protein
VTALRGPVLADSAMSSSIYPLPGFVHPGLSIDTGNGSRRPAWSRWIGLVSPSSALVQFRRITSSSLSTTRSNGTRAELGDTNPIRYIIVTAWYPVGTSCTGRSPCGTLVVSPIARIRARMDVEEPVWHGQIASK